MQEGYRTGIDVKTLTIAGDVIPDKKSKSQVGSDIFHH
jgi:hypothetical protein